MGDYAEYIIGSYAIAAVVFSLLTLKIIFVNHRLKSKLNKLEQER